jgi:Zn-dependent metalloprotease
MLINLKFEKLVYVFLTLIGVACSPRLEYSKIKWTQGDNENSLAELKKIETNHENSNVLFSHQKYEFYFQNINGTPVHNTFVKKVLTPENKPLRIEAVITPVRLLDKYLVSNRQPMKKTNFYLKQLGIDEKFFKNQSFNFEYFKNKDHFEKYLVLNYEKNDGTLWQAVYNHSDVLVQNKRLGSSFIDAYATVYPFGPKMSGLETILLPQLDHANILSNDFVRVDNESIAKISTISSVLKFDPQDDQFDQVQVFHYLNTSIRWMKDHLNVSFPNRIHAVVNVGYPKKTNTAFYYNQKIRLGRGDDVDYAMISSDPSIVFHESFHFLIDGLARLPFDGEGGSINEAFADFFTAAALKNPKLGESAYLKNPFKRTIDIKINRAEITGGLYHDSQIISGLLWEIYQKIGEVKSLKISTTVLSELNPASQFDDFNASLLKVIKMQLSADEVKVVEDILKSRGFFHE